MSKTKHWLMTIAVLLCSIAASAHDFEVGGIYYNVTSSTDLTVEVTYRGSSFYEYNYEYSGIIAIPATVTYNNTTYWVTSIGDSAFDSCNGLTSITIPKGVTSIGGSAFRYCSGLTSIILPEGVTWIGYGAFRNCSNLTSITLPASVTSIGSYAFSETPWYNNLLDGVVYVGNVLYGYKGTMPENSSIEVKAGVVSISSSAFQNRSNLTSITFPVSMTSIGNSAFRSCSNLTSITLPEGVTKIEGSAFRGCSNLTTIIIPANVTSIGYAAFFDCNGLVSIASNVVTPPVIDETFYNGDKSIPVYVPVASVESYKAAEGWNEFSNIQPMLNIIDSGTCGTNLTWKFSDEGKLIIEGTGGMSQWTSGYDSVPWSDYRSNIKSVDICNGVTSIGIYAFYGCGNLTSVTIPNSVTSIAPFAFENCYKLTSINLPQNITNIYEGTFRNCGITSITIPNSVVNIGERAFYSSGLASIHIPKNVANIENEAFAVCRNLSSIVVAEDNAVYDSRNNCNAIIETNSNTLLVGCSTTIIPNDVVIIGNYAFEGSCITSVDIPQGVTKIGTMAFSYCYNLVSVNIPYNSQLTDIGYGACCGCSVLASFNIPESVISIGEQAFIACRSLTSINIPQGVTTIEDATFSSCNSLLSITIPESVTLIGHYAFNGCCSFESITCLAETLPETGYNVFDGVNKSIPVYVPASSISAYQAAEGWNEFTNIQGMPNVISINQYGSTTYCSEYALDFSGVNGLKAYAATGYNTSTGIVTLTRVMTSQPGMGLFLKGEPGEYVVPTLKSTNDNSLNMLVGTLGSTVVNGTSNDGLYYNYRYTIKSGETTPMFYRVDDGYTLSAGKAYLQIPTAWLPVEAKAIGLRFVDAHTTDVEDLQLPMDNALSVYDLMGRKVANPQEGVVYIVNGKKMVWE